MHRNETDLLFNFHKILKHHKYTIYENSQNKRYKFQAYITLKDDEENDNFIPVGYFPIFEKVENQDNLYKVFSTREYGDDSLIYFNNKLDIIYHLYSHKSPSRSSKLDFDFFILHRNTPQFKFALILHKEIRIKVWDIAKEKSFNKRNELYIKIVNDEILDEELRNFTLKIKPLYDLINHVEPLCYWKLSHLNYDYTIFENDKNKIQYLAAEKFINLNCQKINRNNIGTDRITFNNILQSINLPTSFKKYIYHLRIYKLYDVMIDYFSDSNNKMNTHQNHTCESNNLYIAMYEK